MSNNLQVLRSLTNNDLVFLSNTFLEMEDVIIDRTARAAEALKPATGYVSTSLHEAVKLRLGMQGIAAEEPTTIPQFFQETVEAHRNEPALVYETPGMGGSGWTTLTYDDYECKVRQAAMILLHIGLQPRSSVGILAFNCPEWFIIELAAIQAGGVVTGIYISSSAEMVHHVLDTSEATVCVVDTREQMAKVRAGKARLPRLAAVVQLQGPYDDFVDVEPGYCSWEQLLRMKFDSDLHQELAHRERNVAANECALLIYTSGTTGMPKAVMLSHDAIIHDIKALSANWNDVEPGNERVVSFLPMNHVAAQIWELLMPIKWGFPVYFADPNAMKGSLVKTLTYARPTRFLGVPRIYEKFQESILQKEASSMGVYRYAIQKARVLMQRYHMDRIEGKNPSQLSYWFASNITRRLQQSLGLDQCKLCAIGGAPVSTDLKLFFLGLDLPLTDVYGASEASGAVTTQTDKLNIVNSGKPIDGFELKIFSPDSEGLGEVCVRGRGVLMGYLNDIESTKAVLKEDGWLHTGDLGYLDSEGYLVIAGRLKELIITSGGENIPPVYIEELIKRELPAVSYAILVGDRRKYLTVLLTLGTEIDPNTGLPLDILRPETQQWLRSLGLHYKLLSEVLNTSPDLQKMDGINAKVTPHPLVVAAIDEGIKRANGHALSNAQKVQKFALLPHDFSMATGELSPTLKVKRHYVLSKYGYFIDELYA